MDEETEMHIESNNNENEFNQEEENMKTLFFQKFNALEEQTHANK